MNLSFPKRYVFNLMTIVVTKFLTASQLVISFQENFSDVVVAKQF